MKIICSYSFGVHTHLTEKKLTNFIRHEIVEMKTLQKLDSQQHLSQPHRNMNVRSNIPTHMHDAMHAVYVHACEEQYVVLPYFC